jgi:hypothetical protein
MTSGQLTNAATASVAVNQSATVSIGGTATASASTVTVSYPFTFMVLQPVARLIVSGSTMGTPFTLTASAEMRNEQ